MASPGTTDRTTRTNALVLQVATEVFAAEGFHGADVQVIADRLNAASMSAFVGHPYMAAYSASKGCWPQRTART